MEKIFLSILNMSLTASFIITVIILARLPLKKAPKFISYALWAVAGFRLVIPFTFESVFSLIPFKSQSIPYAVIYQETPQIDSGIYIIDNAVNAILPVAASNTNTPSTIMPFQTVLLIGSFVWLLGVLTMLLYSFVSIILLKRRLHGAALIEGNLYEADNLRTPFVIGLLKPKIYIPMGLTDEECRYIVLHEQTHIRSGDHVVKMFAYYILCLHWFNPLVWVAFVLMGTDMEMSCDERVVSQLGVDIKKAYSLSLVRVAVGHKILNGNPLAFSEGGMKERIKNVLNLKKPSRLIIALAVVLVAVLSVGFALNRVQNNIPTLLDTELKSVVKTYSPDNNYFIEGYDVDYNSQVSGLNPIKQFRIVDTDSGKTLWNMDGLFLIISAHPFAWSLDSRYVYVAYAGRTWKDVLVVDTTDMSEYPLPGISELAPLFPNTTPDDNRPDPYIEAFSWHEHKLSVSFSWRIKEDVEDEDNRIYGEYMYDADTQDYELRYDLGELSTESNEIFLPDKVVLQTIDDAVKWYLNEKEAHKYLRGNYFASSYKILDTIETSESVIVFTHILCEWISSNGENVSGGTGLTSITFKKNGNEYKYEKSLSYPKLDSPEIPLKVKEAMDNLSHFVEMRSDIDEDIANFLETIENNLPKSTTNAPTLLDMSEVSQRVEDALRIIMSSPMTSSNPKDYINEHSQEYENLTAKFPEGVMEYLLSQFEADNADGLRGHIMMHMCKDMLGLQNNVTDDSLSPQEWYSRLSIISEVEVPDFKPENPTGVYDGGFDGKEYGGIINSAIRQYYGDSDNGFLVYAPTIHGIYEEYGKLKAVVTVYYMYYRLYGKTLESKGGGIIPGAIVFTKENRTGGWVFEEYLEVGSGNLPDGAYYGDSVRKLCVMPVSGNEIKGLADKMNSDYTNDARNELLIQSLKEHLTVYGQTGVSLKKLSGEMIPLT